MGVSFLDFISAPTPKRSPLPTMGRGSESETTTIAPDQAARRAEQAARPALETFDLPFGMQRDVNQIAQGATFGFSDELAAAGRALFGEKWDDAIASERGGLAKFQLEHPGRAFIEQMAGGVGGTMAGGGALKALGLAKPLAATASTLQKVRRASSAGALAGGAAGAGSAEGGLDERAGTALVGAGAGAALGFGLGTLGEGLARMMRASETPQQAADRLLRQAMSRDKMTIPAALAKATTFSEDKPATILDIGGRNTQRLGRSVRTAVGRGSGEIDEALTQRGLQSEQRVVGDVLAASGGKRENAFRTAKDLIKERGENAQPIYERANAGPPVTSSAVQKLLKDPFAKSIYGGAMRQAGRELPEGVTLPSLADAQAGAPIPIQLFDYIKKGTDDFIQTKMGSSTIGSNEARQVRTLLKDALESVDAQNADYAAARAQFAGDSQLMKAFENGRKLFTMDPDDAVVLIEDMSEGERALFRRGGLNSYIGRIEQRAAGRDPGDALQRTWDRQRLRMLFDDDASFDAFRKRLTEESQMHRTKTFVQGNSQSADKIAEALDMAELPTGAITDALTGNVGGLIRRGLGTMVEKGADKWRQGAITARADALGTRLQAGLKNRKALIDALEDIRANTSSTSARPIAIGGRAVSSIIRGAAPPFTEASLLAKPSAPLQLPPGPPSAFPVSAGQPRTPQEEEARRLFEFLQAVTPPQR